MPKRYTGSQEVVIPVEALEITIDVVDPTPPRLYVLVSRDASLPLIDRDTDNLLLSRDI